MQFLIRALMYVGPCSGIESCKDGDCTCQEGFEGDDCCTEVEDPCSISQDIFLLIDTTLSYSTENFCEVNFGTELLLTGFNPTDSLVGTRVAAFLYPKVFNIRDPGTSLELFPLGSSCELSVGKTATLIDGFYSERRRNDPPAPYVDYQKGSQTIPGTAFTRVTEVIQERINHGETDRSRVVIIITDGGNSTDSTEQINALRSWTN